MKAAVRHVFGAPEVLEVEELPKPVPTGDEVLVRIRAASGNPADWHVIRGAPLLMRFMGFGLFRPKSAKLGADIAGEVEAGAGMFAGPKPAEGMLDGNCRIEVSAFMDAHDS